MALETISLAVGDTMAGLLRSLIESVIAGPRQFMEERRLESELRGHYRKRLRESLDIMDAFVDPLDAVRDADGVYWTQLSPALDSGNGVNMPIGFRTEPELRMARNQGRYLRKYNEFAINGHENRISYVVGTGHTYKIVAKRRRAVPSEVLGQAQQVIDDFCERNKWGARQQESLDRYDRDGESFMRFFVGGDGKMVVRFVEPWQVMEPGNSDADSAFGIKTDSQDVETVLAYYIDGEPVDASAVQHRKNNVGANVRRGVPLFFPVRENLRRCESLMKNMAALSDIRSRIALIRKRKNLTNAAANAFQQKNAAATVTNQLTGQTTYIQKFLRGAIIDTDQDVDYEFPSAMSDASQFVAVLQAELRGIASRLVMPEFMLTSDASNANYSSTMVAEGPAVKYFTRLQAAVEADDLVVMRKVLLHAEARKEVPPGILRDIEIQVGKPNVQVREQLKEAQASNIMFAARTKSPQTWCAENDLDFEQEYQNWKEFALMCQKDGLPLPAPLSNHSSIDAETGGQIADGNPQQPPGQ